MKLTYHRCGDYLLPDLGLTEEEQHPLGKYGRMRLNYLRACLRTFNKEGARMDKKTGGGDEDGASIPK